ncbi:TMEM175 family protein [Nonomuraea sp. 3-1Str]|uniref:TMEM175 family protein n=1 Tax=Nonomuraea sp. 3-1Str TaxID=2929801 RepID=UPI0028568F83|nr:TMEM175 family protein [Nonomuraea sp. 3-1Str]MDR8407502.1 TMEM175 family protein [Nonomuraea sp. 3-1Str]
MAIDDPSGKHGGPDAHEAAPPAGLTHERVGMFTDAVFAIAMTLLAIELPRPEGEAAEPHGDRLAMAAELWQYLSQHSGTFLAFFIAFMMLWTAWRQHHRLFDRITYLSRGMMLLHLPMLIFVALLPYPTALIGDNSANPLSVTLFAGSEAVLLLCQAALITSALRGPIKAGTDIRRLRVLAVSLWAVGGFWLLTAALTWVMENVPLLWLLTPVVAVAAVRVGRRLVPEPAGTA